jgi:hypothetical protein
METSRPEGWVCWDTLCITMICLVVSAEEAPISLPFMTTLSLAINECTPVLVVGRCRKSLLHTLLFPDLGFNHFFRVAMTVEQAFRVFIGNLSFGVTEDLLAEAMLPAGAVLIASVILDRQGRSRGYGYVQCNISVYIPQICRIRFS